MAYLAKAQQNLAAELALQSGHFDVCGSRAYYAAFQSTGAALWPEGIRPLRERDNWSRLLLPGWKRRGDEVWLLPR